MAGLGLCRDCHHWVGFRFFPEGWRVCDIAATAGNLPTEHVPSGALALAMGWSEDNADAQDAELATAPDYGCVQFQPLAREE